MQLEVLSLVSFQLWYTSQRISFVLYWHQSNFSSALPDRIADICQTLVCSNVGASGFTIIPFETSSATTAHTSKAILIICLTSSRLPNYYTRRVNTDHYISTEVCTVIIYLPRHYV